MANGLPPDLCGLFSALADPTRLAVVERLCGGAATVTELAKPFPMALPTFSRHLKVLEQAGLVSRTVEGRVHTIRVNRAALDRLRGWLDGTASPEAPGKVSREEVRRRLFELPVGRDRDRAIAQAEALARELAPQMEVVRLALAGPGPEGPGFSPTVHAGQQLARRAQHDPAIAASLAEADRLHTAFARHLEAARSGGAVEPLIASIYPLSRLIFAWRSHPYLKDAFPLAASA